ncbi:hypothetical protein LCGC14_2300740 [marine sediment metagenome]|uniref:Uncharacterized protein n=1 Tax=marine sediment metagenome TaxID=412755 RepID=A0A0F9CNI8_9ZZZZ
MATNNSVPLPLDMQSLLARLKGATDPVEKTKLLTRMKELSTPSEVPALPVEVEAASLTLAAPTLGSVEIEGVTQAPLTPGNGDQLDLNIQRLLQVAPHPDSTVKEALGGVTVEATDQVALWLGKVRAGYKVQRLALLYRRTSKARGMPSWMLHSQEFRTRMLARMKENFNNDTFARRVIRQALNIRPTWTVASLGRFLGTLAGDGAYLGVLEESNGKL